MTKQLTIRPRAELAEPQRMTVSVPAVHTGGFIESAINRKRWEATARATDALTRLNTSEAALFNAQTQLVDSAIKKGEALARLQELPERLSHDLAVRRTLRWDQLREVQHSTEMNETRRTKERTEADTELTHVLIVNTDAHQQLDAQKKYGGKKYELQHLKTDLEMLKVELTEQQAHALLRKELRKIEGEDEDLDRRIEEDVAKIFDTHRDFLNAAGMDTDHVDAVQARRRK